MALKCFSEAFHTGAPFLQVPIPAAAAHPHCSVVVRPSPSHLRFPLGEGVLRHRRPSPRALSRPKQGPDELTRRDVRPYLRPRER